MSTKEQYWKYSSLSSSCLWESSSSAKSLLFGGIAGSTHHLHSCTRTDESSGRKTKAETKHQRTVDYRRNDFRLSYPFGIDCLDGGKQVTGYQSGSTDLYCTYSTGSRIHQRENRIRCIGKRYAVIHHVHTSPYRTNYNGKHQQPCHQPVRHDLCPLFHADWRKKDGSLCQ